MKTRQNLYPFLFVLMLSTIFGCKKKEETKNVIKPNEELYKIENIKLNYVPDSTYTYNSENGNMISFDKSLGNSSTIISLRNINQQKFDNDDHFLVYAEKYVQNQMESYEMKSLHLEAVGLKKTTCLRFDGTFRDSTKIGTNEEYISHEGYLCLIPDNNSEIIEIKVVHYSTERFMPKEVVYEFQDMVEKLNFKSN